MLIKAWIFPLYANICKEDEKMLRTILTAIRRILWELAVSLMARYATA